ncbi:hypothetical protein CPB86DRAFT_800668 [Serendipita vermifera]|nr:hypothetical protein CPB86DRAFT_800668 [Serendipita vermifera]
MAMQTVAKLGRRRRTLWTPHLHVQQSRTSDCIEIHSHRPLSEVSRVDWLENGVARLTGRDWSRLAAESGTQRTPNVCSSEGVECTYVVVECGDELKRLWGCQYAKIIKGMISLSTRFEGFKLVKIEVGDKVERDWLTGLPLGSWAHIFPIVSIIHVSRSIYELRWKFVRVLSGNVVGYIRLNA